MSCRRFRESALVIVLFSLLIVGIFSSVIVSACDRRAISLALINVEDNVKLLRRSLLFRMAALSVTIVVPFKLSNGAFLQDCGMQTASHN